MALVLSAQRAVSGVYRTDDPFYQSAPRQVTRALWRMRVQVQPSAEPAFDASLEAWLFDTERPWSDTLVPVLYDASDHRKVVFDHSAGARLAAQQATFAMREEWLQEQSRNPVDRLTELMQLRDRSMLTEAEYEERKRKLLGQWTIARRGETRH